MARSEHLPIYKASSPRYGLRPTRGNRSPITLSSERKRAYRRVGSDLRDGARRVLKLIVRANARADKSAVLLRIREELEELKVLCRMARASSLAIRPAQQNGRWSIVSPFGPLRRRAVAPLLSYRALHRVLRSATSSRTACLALRAAAVHRFGYAFLAGFPVWLAARFAERSLDAGMAVAIVKRENVVSRGLTLLVPTVNPEASTPVRAEEAA